MLEPLLELDPELALPDGTPLAAALEALGEAERVERAGMLRPGWPGRYQIADRPESRRLRRALVWLGGIAS